MTEQLSTGEREPYHSGQYGDKFSSSRWQAVSEAESGPLCGSVPHHTTPTIACSIQASAIGESGVRTDSEGCTGTELVSTVAAALTLGADGRGNHTKESVMLVLSRREKQEIIAGDIRITIIKIGKETVKVGIDAPQEVKVMRSELLKGGSECPQNTNDGQKSEPE